MLEIIQHWADQVIQAIGPWGAAGFMALESMIAPVPSEVVMPPLGMYAYDGNTSWELALFATSLGSLVGSLISYYMGYFGGKPLVMKVGKWLLINEHHLDLTTDWFKRHGGSTVFICRFVPVVRHFISIPAGVARMNLARFCIYTVIGATIWNTLLFWVGWKLRDQWTSVMKYRTPLDIAMVVVILGVIVAWYYIHLKKPRMNVPVESESKV